MPEDDTIATDAPAQDTGASAGPASAETQPAASPEPQDAHTAVADPGTESAAPSTTEQPVQTESDDKQPVDWQDRYRNLQSYADRRHQGYQTHLTKLQQELQQMRQTQEQAAQQAKLRPWSKQHPENSKFTGLLERGKAIHRQLQEAQKLDSDKRVAAEQAIMAGVSPEEQQELANYREEMQAFQNGFFSSPEETLAPFIERGVAAAMQKMQSEMQGKQMVERDFSMPHMKPILEDPRYAGYLNERLARGVPYADAMEMLKLRAAADLMYGKLHGAERTATHAQEQSRLVKQRASSVISADPSAAPVDPYRLAKKEAERLGIQPGTSAFNKLIDRFTAA